ncbi:hypothetical protein Dshi_0037 [Dinoroseobacter shibae DFL 12 = DSM 16493]|jgi:hypothetical protein|uniref:Ice-binding protein C-terminal domain-containing protein n=1 Tax=Dinoroseobacter shibae (strain DSM 16493 / NCIMB 14021 / DFL 12) TaxID=398580 RepID=A8LJW0_DINSH|nr:VPLPA-CTERM sorting domain-containing protein [Dinoroseobacter shibae]ABV91786.1 hypothetical protein Dshi_0037 [Dinoroseobacter shibae DFL 12 = DSM 16493]URF46768.1 VPLPA-CTERM sorting domain-containing protein [Dinoroseobacter shibae]URF51079.1 VPLPA-CTERM sorting domain-containing protein [Dinoroseobacter shibae]
MRKLLLTSLVALCPAVASATTLAGDTVNLALPGFGAVDVVVGSGIEFDLDGTTFDLNPNGTNNLLVVDGDVFGTVGNVSSLVISDMNFNDGSELTGFLVTQTNLVNLQVSFTADSLTFTFDPNTDSPNGILLEGAYLTQLPGAGPTPVPLPATAPLLLLAAGGLAVMRRRKARG